MLAHAQASPRLQNEDVFPMPLDEMLSRDLLQMSVQERNAIYEEMHGVTNLCPEETPEFLSRSLSELDHELQEIPTNDKIAYQEAQGFKGTYVKDAGFQLKFLRTDLFDAKKAAIRMVKFLDLLKSHYGVTALRRPIQLSDLGKKEMECMRTGNHQFLPYRDRSGRRIIAVVTDLALGYAIEIRIKLLIYMFWVSSEEVETQRKGLVVINWPNSDVPLFPERKEPVLGQQAMQAVPMRVAALHMCLPDKVAYRLVKANIALIMGDERKRIKIHLGNRTELQYNLQSYGIYVNQIPITETGNVKLNNLNQWLKVRRAIETRDSTKKEGKCMSGNMDSHESIIECPGMNDVIFRLGKSCLFHPGNHMFRSLIEDIFEAHDNAATQEEKVLITWSVIDRVLIEKKGRFLVWNSRGGWWSELNDRSQIRSKVAVYIREFKKRVKAMGNRRVNESSTNKFEDQDGRKRSRASICGDGSTGVVGKTTRVDQGQEDCFWSGCS